MLNDKERIERLCEENMRYAYQLMAHHRKKKRCNDINLESEGLYALFNAARCFNGDGNFKAYFYTTFANGIATQTKNQILKREKDEKERSLLELKRQSEESFEKEVVRDELRKSLDKKLYSYEEKIMGSSPCEIPYSDILLLLRKETSPREIAEKRGAEVKKVNALRARAKAVLARDDTIKALLKTIISA